MSRRHPQCGHQTRRGYGIAFDGDLTAVSCLTKKGSFIEGYYIVGLLAEAFLEKNPGAKIIHDPRLSWNTVDVVTAAGALR